MGSAMAARRNKQGNKKTLRRNTRTPVKAGRKARRPSKVSAVPTPAAAAAAVLLPGDTRAVAPPAPVSHPGRPSVVEGRPPVPLALTEAQHVAWNNVLRNTAMADRLYRPVTNAADVPCVGCDVDCCTQQVPVNVVDIRRLALTLNLAPREFTQLIPWRNGLPVHPVSWGETSCALALRQRPDGSCAFLVRLGVHRRCGVHGLRPDACRIFPFVADVPQQHAQPRGRLLQLHPSHCPWRWPVDDVQRETLLEDLSNNRRHRALDRELLSQWAGPAREDAFYAWLDDALDALL